MESFKKYRDIEKEITLESKVDEKNRLFVFYDNRWIQLSHEKNPNKFLGYYTLSRRYDSKLCVELGLRNPGKYSKELYSRYKLKNRIKWLLKNITLKKKPKNWFKKIKKF